MASFLERNSKAINTASSAFLALICLLMYALLALLYLSPTVFGIDSFVHPPAQPSPQVVVSICTALLAAATGALVTRCVEHSFWLKLSMPVARERRLTMANVRDLAEWTVSPLRRFTYLFDGSDLPLRPAGVLLLTCAFVGTVLLSGISETTVSTTSVTQQPATNTNQFAGWLDISNTRYNGGNYRDVPGTIAATVALSNLTAPAAVTRCEADTNCRAEAIVGAIHATCASWTVDNTADPVGCLCLSSSQNRTFHSATASIFQTDRGVTLSTNSPYTFANFATTYINGTLSDSMSQRSANPAPGDFALILGAWVPDDPTTAVPPAAINMIDCRLTFGTQILHQTGSDTPQIIPNTFTPSLVPLSTDHPLAYMSRIYGESDVSPWSFAVGAVGTGATVFFEQPVAFLLLRPNAMATAGEVALAIPNALDTATMMAWARAPEAAAIRYVQTVQKRIYVYRPWVLLMLLVPALATALGVTGRCRVGAREMVPGYDPLVIASRGVVVGTPCLRGGIAGLEGERRVHGVFYEEGGVRWIGWACEDVGREGGWR